jgi:hypothetical protein
VGSVKGNEQKEEKSLATIFMIEMGRDEKVSVSKGQ